MRLDNRPPDQSPLSDLVREFYASPRYYTARQMAVAVGVAFAAGAALSGAIVKILIVFA